MTIRELAKKLKLSKSTVAAALNGSPTVHKKTRDRVQAAAEKWGYAANPVVSAFFQKIRTHGTVRHRANLALIMEPYGLSIPWEQLFQGMSSRAQELGYAVDKVNILEYDASSLTRVLVARGVLGIFVGSLINDMDQISLDWDKFAAIAFGYSMARPGLHRVVPDHAQCLRTAFSQCRSKGFRRIGLVLPEESDSRSNGLWSSCFLGLQRKLPEAEQVKPLLLPSGAYTTSNLRKWLRQEKPEAVIFHYQKLVLRHAEIFQGPFAKIYPVVLDRMSRDSLAGIDQQFGRCGAQLADQLSLQILHNERGVPAHPTITMVDGVWVE